MQLVPQSRWGEGHSGLPPQRTPQEKEGREKKKGLVDFSDQPVS